MPALARRGARAFLWLPAVTAALVAGPLMGLHLNLPREARRPSVRLLTYNVWFGARDPRAIAEEVRAAMPDIVLFQAAAPPADVSLKSPPFEQYLYLHEASFVVASRYPVRLVSQGRTVFAHLGPPYVRFAVETPLGTLDLFSVHPHSPRALFAYGERGLRRVLAAGPLADPGGVLQFLDEQLEEIDAATRAGGPLRVVAGDFNVPERSALLRGRFEGTEDAFASAGNGYGYTFPVLRTPPWMRLDRVLLGPGLSAARARVVGHGGSDHAPLLVEIVRK